MASKTNIQKGVIRFDYLKALDKLRPEYLNKIFITYRGGNLDHVNNNSDWYRINNTNFLVNVYLDHDKNKLYILSLSKITDESQIEDTVSELDNLSIGGKKRTKKTSKKKSPGRPKLRESEEDMFEVDYNDVNDYGGKKRKSIRKPKHCK